MSTYACTTCGKTVSSRRGLRLTSVRTAVPADQRCYGHDPLAPGAMLARLLVR